MKILITGKSGFIGQELSKIIPIKLSNAHIFDLGGIRESKNEQYNISN